MRSDQNTFEDTDRTVRFWRRANWIGLIACIVALPADLSYAQSNKTGIVVVRCAGYACFLAFIALGKQFVARYYQQLFLALVIMVSLTMSYITIYTKGPETLYFMGIVEVMLAVLLIGNVNAFFAGLACVFSFSIFTGFLVYGGFVGKTFVPSESFSSVLLSLAIFLVLAYFLNSIITSYRVARDREYAEKNHILSNVEDAIFSLDSEMQLVQMNASAVNMLKSIGEYQPDMKGKKIKAIFPELAESKVFHGIDKVIEEKKDLVFENYFPILDKHFSVKIVPFESGAVVYFHDITDHIRREQLARNTAAEAQRKNEFKTKLISIINHELRSPILSMVANAEIIAIGQGADAARKTAEDIVSAGKSVQRLIIDLLDFSAAELGKLRVDQDKPASVKEVFSEVRSILGLKELLNDELLQALAPYSLRCEKIRVVQIFVNLLGNAEKYAADGNIILTYELKPMSMIFRIKSKTELSPERIRFQLFERDAGANGAQGRDVPGFGLGLYIVKNILDTVGGYIWVTREGGLIVFNTELPLATTESRPTETPES